MSKRALDPRIGIRGGISPLVCAVTGQHVMGNHNTAYKIQGKYYFRILDKVAITTEEKDNIRKKLSKLISAEIASSPRKKEVKHD